MAQLKVEKPSKDLPPSDMDSDNSSSDFHMDIFQLPIEDILQGHILPYLDIVDLCNLAATCLYFKEIVPGYWGRIKVIDVGNSGKNLKAEQLTLLFQGRSKISHLLLQQCSSALIDNILAILTHQTHNLTVLNLTNCISLTNQSLLTLKPSSRNLRQLILRDCVWVNPDAFINLTLRCRFLEELDVSGCWHINNSVVASICASCRRLKKLSLSRIYGITDTAVKPISQNLPHLVELSLKDCWRVTDYGIWYLSEFAHQLKVLFVSGCRSVKPEALDRMHSRGVIIDTYQTRPGYEARPVEPFLQV